MHLDLLFTSSAPGCVLCRFGVVSKDLGTRQGLQVWQALVFIQAPARSSSAVRMWQGNSDLEMEQHAEARCSLPLLADDVNVRTGALPVSAFYNDGVNNPELVDPTKQYCYWQKPQK